MRRVQQIEGTVKQKKYVGEDRIKVVIRPSNYPDSPDVVTFMGQEQASEFRLGEPTRIHIG